MVDKIKPRIELLTDPDQVTAHLRLADLYARQRKEKGPGKTSTADLLTEADIVLRLLATEMRARINFMGEIVGRSIERRMASEGSGSRKESR